MKPNAADTRSRSRLIAFLNSYTEGMSGGDACFIEFAKRLRGMDIVVVTSSLGASMCRANGVRAQFWITTREAAFRRTIITYLVRMLLGCILAWRIGNRDVVYSTSDFLPDVLPAFCAALRVGSVVRIQRIFHLLPRSRPVPYYAQRLSHLLLRRRVDLLIVDNALLRDELQRRGFDSRRLEVSYPGLDLAQYMVPTPDDGTRYDAVYLGRIHRSKGVFELVDIWTRVCQARPRATLAIVGRGDPVTVNELERLIAKVGLADRIVLLGFLPTHDAIAVMRQSHMFVAPSAEEGFGMAVLEAIATDLPVVAWDLPVYREVFPEALLLVKPSSPDRFASAILRLECDSELRDRLVQAGRRLVPRYDWDLIAERESKLIQSLVSPNSP